MKNYDVIIVGGGPGGIYSAYELKKLAPEKRVAVFEEGHPLEKRRCPIDGVKIKSCIRCKTCSIMSGCPASAARAPSPTANTTSPTTSAAPSTSTSARRKPWSS